MRLKIIFLLSIILCQASVHSFINVHKFLYSAPIGISNKIIGQNLVTTINSGTTLIISTNQTVEDIELNGGTLQINSGATLTVTGNYTSTSGIINNNGFIKLAGGSCIFPGGATLNNGVINTLSNLEIASTGVVTLNSTINITNTLNITSGIAILGANLHLNNATLNITSGSTFDNGGDNQIINNANGVIVISGTFITRDPQGFVGSNTSIPSITPIINSGSTIGYGLNGNQAVQGTTSPPYYNISFTGSGTKTLISENAVTGTITISENVIFNASNKTFGGSTTNVTMIGNAIYKLGGAGTRPTATGIFSLDPSSTLEFTGNSDTKIRLIGPTINYANIIVSGSNVSTSGLSTGIKFQAGGKFTVKSGARFKINSTAGFTGGTDTAINTITNGGPAITLETGSTIEYEGANQNITAFLPAYPNLTISGTGIKTTTDSAINISNNLNIDSSQLTINNAQTLIVANEVNNSGGIILLENNSSLVQINNTTNTGNITYNRIPTSYNDSDYTYWSSPTNRQNLLSISPLTEANKFYTYDSAIDDWTAVNAATTTMNVGQGYIATGQGTPSTSSFIGVPNNGDITIAAGTAGNSNLLGNPYPSALYADAFLDINSGSGAIEGTIYFWTHNTGLQLPSDIIAAGGIPGSGVYAYTSDDYASYNLTGGVGTAESAISDLSHPGGNVPNVKISTGQGFFVTSNGGGIVSFNNSMRLNNSGGTLDNSQFFRNKKTKSETAKATIIEKSRVWLNLINTEGAFKQTLIGYITNATNEYDTRFDGESFDGNKFVDFYSINKDKHLSIQGRTLPFDENEIVSLGYRTTIDGEFTIKIDHTDGFLSDYDIYIEDHLMNGVFNLKTGGYIFNTSVGTFNDRFVIRYINRTTQNNNYNEDQVLISNNKNQIKINSTCDLIDKIWVYDVLGNILFKKENTESTEFTFSNLNPNQQILLVKVTLKNGKNVCKKIIY